MEASGSRRRFIVRSKGESMSARLTVNFPDVAGAFPTLMPPQIERIATHGRVRATGSGEVLADQGDKTASFFVVKAGAVEVVRPSGAGETLIAVLGAGQFSGESNMISGRRGLVRLRV